MRAGLHDRHRARERGALRVDRNVRDFLIADEDLRVVSEVAAGHEQRRAVARHGRMGDYDLPCRLLRFGVARVRRVGEGNHQECEHNESDSMSHDSPHSPHSRNGSAPVRRIGWGYAIDCEQRMSCGQRQVL
jgi:hypothetical protein